MCLALRVRARELLRRSNWAANEAWFAVRAQRGLRRDTVSGSVAEQRSAESAQPRPDDSHRPAVAARGSVCPRVSERVCSHEDFSHQVPSA